MTTVFNSSFLWSVLDEDRPAAEAQGNPAPFTSLVTCWCPSLGRQRDLAALPSAKPFMGPMLKASLHHSKAQNSPTHHSCQWEFWFPWYCINTSIVFTNSKCETLMHKEKKLETPMQDLRRHRIKKKKPEISWKSHWLLNI